MTHRDRERERRARAYAQVMGYASENSHRVGEMVAEIEAARLIVYRAAWQADTQPPSIQPFDWWLRAKLAVGTAVQRIVNHAVIAGGVHSLFRAEGLEIKLRDATSAPIQPPNSDFTVGLLTMRLDPGQAPSLTLEPASRVAPARG